MRRCHPPSLPKFWLMTDERMGDGLFAAIERLPRGSGVIFRHYATPVAERRALFAGIAATARRRRLVLLRGGGQAMRGEQGRHGRDARARRGVLSWPAHNRAEVIAGARAGADLILVSPVFATRSHPDARPLGIVRAAMMVHGVRCPVIALGGVNRATARRLAGLFDGWAAIDAWAATPENQKRSAVPT